MILSVHQPQYLPWLGYFHKIFRSDLFIFLDNVQYKKREFQNRNRIKTADGVKWLTVPVITKGKYNQKIRDVLIDNENNWIRSHLEQIKSAYRNTKFFNIFFPQLELFFKTEYTHLNRLNTDMVLMFLKLLDIKTPVRVESEFAVNSTSTQRIIDLCKATGSETYLSGAGGKDYMDLGLFKKAGIKVIFQEYKHPIYSQKNGDFEPYMCILDLLFNKGYESLNILTGQDIND